MDGAFLLDVVVAEGTAVFQLFAAEDQALLVWGDAFLVLDHLLDAVNGVRGLKFKGYGFAGECLDEDLHVVLPT